LGAAEFANADSALRAAIGVLNPVDGDGDLAVVVDAVQAP
jgi:3-deoxy-D-arabino-heptulosonate 7-phosphate (DAHP) synthase